MLSININLHNCNSVQETLEINIGTQSVQELFFYDSIRRTVYSNDLVKFFGCDIQQERNWEFMMYIPCYIGNGKIAK